MKTNFLHFMPAAFCALIMYTSFSFAMINHDYATGLKSAFYVQLPLCFILLAQVTLRLEKELKDLRARLAALEQKKID